MLQKTWMHLAVNITGDLLRMYCVVVGEVVGEVSVTGRAVSCN